MKLSAMPGLPSIQLRQQGPLLLALFAILIGMAVPGFVGAVGGSPAKALALLAQSCCWSCCSSTAASLC
ncbi:hypothetical protein LP420_06885 [Massilia sp. B-10]|nr:hypothetical protein LP420_06885 [Massilia sp. B-10]